MEGCYLLVCTLLFVQPTPRPPAHKWPHPRWWVHRWKFIDWSKTYEYTVSVCSQKSEIYKDSLCESNRQCTPSRPLPCGLPRSLVFECCPLGMWMGMCVTTVCIWRSEDHFQSEFSPFTILALGSGLRLGDGASMRWAKYHSWGIFFTSTVSTSLPNSCHSTLKISQLPVSFSASLTAPSSALSRCCLEC